MLYQRMALIIMHLPWGEMRISSNQIYSHFKINEQEDGSMSHQIYKNNQIFHVALLILLIPKTNGDVTPAEF